MELEYTQKEPYVTYYLCSKTLRLMLVMKTKQEHRYRNPEARRLHEDRAFRLKVRNDKRIPHIEEVSVTEATILMEEEKDNED